MKPREVLDRTTTPDGAPLELAIEGGFHVIRVGGQPLMSSAAYGSEQRMAEIAGEKVAQRPRCRVLIGGLGMGFTLRAALDAFGPDARITVAELLPSLVAYNRGPLGPLANHPLDDKRVRLFEGDVRKPLHAGGWDAVLMDVDNGPDAFTTQSNEALYSGRGAGTMARSLNPGGVLVIWSAVPSKPFETTLRNTGLQVETQRVRARTEAKKGPKHTLFVARAPMSAPRPGR